MRTLQDIHAENYRRIKEHIKRLKSGLPLDVECPQCGHELFDLDPGREAMTSPPQIRATCKSCDHVEYLPAWVSRERRQS